MTLIDTSILITYIRKRSPAIKRFLDTNEVYLAGVSRAEVLHGAKDEADRMRLFVFLGEFGTLPVSESTWDTLGDNLARLRRAAISVPLADALIAKLAAANGLPLWSFDAHYTLIQPHIPGLQLLAGPTP
jgi:predicted nucleic acid-binding protein